MRADVRRVAHMRAAGVWRRAPVWTVALVMGGVLVVCWGSAQASRPPLARLVFRATALDGRGPSSALLDRAAEILRARLGAVSRGSVVSRSGDRIVVRVPSAQLSGALAMTVPGRLEFYDWEANALTPDGRPVARGLRSQDLTALEISQGSATAATGSAGAGSLALYDAVKLASEQPSRPRSESARRGPDYYMFGSPGSPACAAAARDQGTPAVARSRCLLDGPDADERDLISGLPAGVSPAEGQILAVPQGTTVLQAAPSGFRNPPRPADRTAQFFVLDDHAALSGDDILDPRPSTDPTGSPAVTFNFTARGQRLFHDVTATLARRGRDLSAHGPTLYQHFALAVDNLLIDVPQIDQKIYPDGIPGSDGAEISNGFTTQFARDLATVLRYGPLPVGLSRVA
jgi:hypothetical protein